MTCDPIKQRNVYLTLLLTGFYICSYQSRVLSELLGRALKTFYELTQDLRFFDLRLLTLNMFVFDCYPVTSDPSRCTRCQILKL